MRYLQLWLSFAKIRLLINVHERWAALFFVVGKFLRFILIGFFILTIADQISSLQGYSKNQLIIVYLLFNFLDLTSQFLFRGVYVFRSTIIHGNFDRDLLSPISSLFSALMTYIDFLDIPLWLVTTGMLGYYLTSFSAIELLLFAGLVVNSMMIIAGIHIFVLAMTIFYTTGDQLITIFRSLSSMARFPIDIYAHPVRLLLNTILPIGIAFTLPANVLFGTASFPTQIFGSAVGLFFLLTSLRLWRYSLHHYSSASS